MRNPEVIKLLETYLEIAKRHKMAHVAIAMASYRGEGLRDMGVCDFAGDIALELSEKETLGLLMDKLDRSIDDWSLPKRDESLAANCVCYNVAAGPLGYDFILWLIDAEMTRIREKAAAPLRVAFWMGKNKRTSPDRLMWLNNVFRPALAFIGAVEDDVALHGHSKEFYCTRDVVAAYKAGETVPKFKALDQFNYLPDSMVTITLREAKHWPERNSHFPAWLRLARTLKDRGENVVFVRDTEKAKEGIPNFPTCPAASLDIGQRLSLYESAKINLFVSNGPGALALFGSKPFLQFVKTEPEGSDFTANTPSFWRDKMGVEIGNQYPWCRPDQRIIWEPDSYENIIRAYDEFING